MNGSFDAQAIFDVLTLQAYQTRVVVIGASLLGAAAGLVGSFMLLRRRALLADTLSHATLPGVAGAFLLATAMGFAGKHLVVLLIGAAIASAIAAACVTVLSRTTRLKQDAILAIVLSVFFGFGTVLSSIVQQTATGSAAGLESFIFGKAATMTRGDAILIGSAGLVVLLICVALFKELRLLCFDPDFARGQGWPVTLLDGVLMTLVVLVTVIGLQAVGLILIIALLVIPPSAARFWTHNLRTMILLSTIFGAASAWVGTSISGLATDLPSGATIVLVSVVLFIVSSLFGSAGGVVSRWIERSRTRTRILAEVPA